MGYPAEAFVTLYAALIVTGVALVSGVLYTLAMLIAQYRKTTVRNFFELALVANLIGIGAILFEIQSESAVYLAAAVLVTEFVLVAIPYALGDILLDVPDPAILGAVPISLLLSLLVYPAPGIGVLPSASLQTKYALVLVVAVLGPTVISWVTWTVQSRL